MEEPGGSAGFLFYRIAPSFNGRTAASGAAYRGSNPWGATKVHFPVPSRTSSFKQMPKKINSLSIICVRRGSRRCACSLSKSGVRIGVQSA